MTVHVTFIGSFRRLAGRCKVDVRFESGLTLKKLVERITTQLPRLKEMLINSETGEPRADVLVLINSMEISLLSGFDTSIGVRDSVVFAPVTHGG